jgi:putative peptidoglycan lipid II flippase
MSLSTRYSGWRAKAASRWSARFSSVHHAHFKIASGIGWTLLFVVIARLIGAGREMVLAAHYGVSEAVDAYLFTFNLLSWPFAVWFNVLGVVLVPAVVRLRQNGDVAALQVFRAGLLGRSLLIGGSIGLVFWLLFGSGLLMPLLGFPSSTANLVRTMISWLAPIVPLGFVASFYSAWVMATGRYVNTLMEAIPPFVIMLAILFFSNENATPLLSGTLLGLILQVLMLTVVLGRMGEIVAPVCGGGGPEWRQFWKNFGVMVVGNILITATGVVDQVMAASLDPGAIATLGYANRIIALMLSLSALTISRTILPIFSAMRAVHDPRLSRMAMQWMAILFLFGAGASIIMWWDATAVINLLFMRGAFTAENARAVVKVFSFALIQIPFYCGSLVLTGLIATTGRYKIMASVGATSLLVKIISNWLLIPLFGAAGIALATSIMYAFSFTVVIAIMRITRI